MMKLDTVIPYLKKITWQTLWVLLVSAFFQRKSVVFAISRNTAIDCILMHNFNFCNFFQSLKVVLLNMVANLMVSAKFFTLGLLELNTCLLWFLSLTLGFLWENVSWPQFYKNLTRKTFFFFEEWSWFKFNSFRLALQPFPKYMRLTLVSMWNSALREKFNFCFSRTFASIDKIFILAGRLGRGLSFREV